MLKRHCFLNILAIALVAMGLSACSNALNEYSRRPCYVVIDNTTRVDATLASAMNALSPGIFCIIQKEVKGGASYYHCSNNQGLSSDILWTAIDQRKTIIIGENNGIIIGFGNLDFPAIFYAYDLECPNCFDPDGIPVKSRPLKMDEKGHATCNVCKRIYDMNNRGYIIQGDQGNPLTRYPASTTGPYGVLAVQ